MPYLFFRADRAETVIPGAELPNLVGEVDAVAGFRVRRKQNAEDAELCLWLEQAQEGNQQARNDLLRAYAPFVLRVTSSSAKRYIHKEQDDEYSIGLAAMNEAIDRFQGRHNVSFLHFAETVIKRRLIDYFRSQRARNQARSWSEFDVQDEDDNVVNYAEVESAVSAHALETERAARVEEIGLYAEELANYGLSFAELTEVSPKHADARQNAMDVARLIAEDDYLRAYVLERKSLPLKELVKQAEVSRKTLERQRKYILAIVVLLCGDYEYLRDYIS